MKNTPAGSSRPLFASLFRESFLQQVGKVVQFQADVPFTLKRDLLLDTIRGAGYDPNNLSQYGHPDDGWRLSGRNSPSESATRKVWRLSGYLARGKNPLTRSLGQGKWVLTSHGAAEATRLFRLTALPPASKEFFNPLLQILGAAVKFRAGRFVDAATLIEDVIRKMGYDPKNLSAHGDPALGWRMDGKDNPDGFRRRLHYAFKNGRTDRRVPLTVIGPRKGEWGLTAAGVEQARKLCGLPYRNVTSGFLDDRLKLTGGINGSLWRLLRAAISAKLPVSAAAGIVDDHIHNCMVNLISRDSLREKVLTGKDIPDTLLATYAVRASFSDIRDMGTNPVTREMFGARTERERAKGIVLGPISDPRVIWSRDGDEDPASIQDMAGDPLDAGGTAALEEYLDFQKYMARLEEVILAKKPKAGDRYLGVLRMKVSGFTIPEIAEEEGVSTFRAASMVAEARRCIQEARQEGSLLFA